MNTRQTIQKILITLFWLCVSGGLLTLLIAANNNKKRGFCRDYKLNIKGTRQNLFVDRNEVLRLVSTAAGGKIKEMKVASFDLRRIEKRLKDNDWIKKAELWFDNKDVLHISITEREPVARIFTSTGSSFYIDSSGWRMPLSDRLSARVPVFTNFPERNRLTNKDSALLNDIKNTALYILDNPFWLSQVAQMDITPERDFEMIPVVGNHIVRLGDGADIEKKFKRLFIFYSQVLSKTGFDKYSFLDVQYEGQVIGTKRGTGKTKVDSAQLKLNVDKLLKQIQQMQSSDKIPANLITEKTNPVKATEDNFRPTESEEQANPGEKKVPKAVMPKKNE